MYKWTHVLTFPRAHYILLVFQLIVKINSEYDVPNAHVIINIFKSTCISAVAHSDMRSSLMNDVLAGINIPTICTHLLPVRIKEAGQKIEEVA